MSLFSCPESTLPVPLSSLTCFSDGDSKMRISQDQLSLTRTPDKTVHIRCKLSGVPLDKAIVHWYQQKEGELLRRILYGSTKSYKLDAPNPRLETDVKEKGVFYLIINKVTKSDEGTYYCACWDLTMSQSHKGPVRKPCLLPSLHSCHPAGTTSGSSMLLIISS